MPDGWAWCRLGNICKWQSGTTPNKKNLDYYKNGTIPWLLTGDLNDDLVNEIPNCITEKALKETSLKINPIGSVCIAMYGATIGKLGILNTPATTNQACCVCYEFYGINNKYLFYFLKEHKEEFILQGFGGAQPNISKEKIVNTFIPLPPLSEQERIVKSIETYFEQIDSLEENKYDLQTAIKQAKSKILDLAIHGKLVPQNPNDEPAEELLKRIATSDNRPYKKFEEEAPYELPSNWSWCYLGDVCSKIKRGKSPKYVDKSTIIAFAQKCNQKDGPTSLEKALYIDETTLKKYPEEEKMQFNDIVINSTGTGTLGRVGIFNCNIPDNITAVYPDSHVTTVRILPEINKLYCYYFIKTKQSYLETMGEGSTNQKELKPDTISSLCFPLPPYPEQKRIVSKIVELFSSLETIVFNLD